MTVTLLRGDARALPLADESVDLIVTSPPYWALRSYTDGGEHYEGQIGAEPTPAAYVDSLIDCTREWVRVLKPTGSLWVNLGDKYAERGGPERDGGVDGGQVNHRAARPRRRGTPDTGVRAKSLIGLPWRYALGCIDELGLILRAEVVWSKPNGLPESVTDRVRRSHETWFHFTRSPRYFAAVDTIREAYDGGTERRYATGFNPLEVVTAGQTRNAVLRADGGGPRATNPLGKLPGSVWEIATQPLKVPAHLGVDHFAAFPMEWPRRIISGWSPSGVCTACGEARRPVTVQVDEAYAAERLRVARHAQGTAREIALREHFGNKGQRTTGGGFSGISNGVVKPDYRIVGEVCACTPYTDHPERRVGVGAARAEVGPAREYPFDQWTAAPTRAAVVLDPFGGTGTTALVAHALGRHGISVDMSTDYCRLAEWRTTDPGQIAAALQVDKPPPVAAGQADLLDLLGSP